MKIYPEQDQGGKTGPSLIKFNLGNGEWKKTTATK